MNHTIADTKRQNSGPTGLSPESKQAHISGTGILDALSGDSQISGAGANALVPPFPSADGGGAAASSSTSDSLVVELRKWLLCKSNSLTVSRL